MKQENDAQRAQQSEVRDEASKFSEIIDSANEEIKNCYATKDKMRESYFKQLYEFELQNDKIKWIKGLINSNKKIAMANEEKQARIAKKRAELENRANPYAK